MGKLKIGVLGAHRGGVMIRFMMQYPDAELVAVCDKYRPVLAKCGEQARLYGQKVALFEDFEAFLGCDMDAVVLANYATEHAPFALRCLETGRHVLSEVMAVQTLREAVQLVEAVERTGLTYAYAENYCYYRAVMEMKKRYRRGDIGEFVHGEGEYVHDCTSIVPQITYGDPNHWRNRSYSSFYISHALGPILTITGARPKRITAFENQINEKLHSYGANFATAAMVMLQMDNGATVKALKGNMKRNTPSCWYNLYGTKGCMESDRWLRRSYVLNVFAEGPESCKGTFECYEPPRYVDSPLSRYFESPEGHSGSDFYTCYFFLEKLLHRPDGAECIDVYQALDMSLPGLLAYRSILAGGQPVDYPDLRDKAVRELYRNDIKCTDPAIAFGEGLLPPNSHGVPPVGPEGYAHVRELWEKGLPG